MARRRTFLFNKNLQMGASIKRSQGSLGLTLALTIALLAGITPANAATTKPSPKASTKPAAQNSAQPMAKPSSTAVAKKVIAKKKVVTKKRIYRKKKIIKVMPSPSPAWPPKGFSADNGVYAKIPTSKELVGVISAAATLASQVKDCQKFVCGAVQVASIIGCTWWEVQSEVSGPTSDTDATLRVLGTLRTTAKATNVKQMITILLISAEPMKDKTNIGKIDITCYHSPRIEDVPTTVYTPVQLPTNTN